MKFNHDIMEHFQISYNEEKRRIDYFCNGRHLGGIIGKLAEDRYKVIRKEVEICDNLLNHAKGVINGNDKTKKTKI